MEDKTDLPKILQFGDKEDMEKMLSKGSSNNFTDKRMGVDKVINKIYNARLSISKIRENLQDMGLEKDVIELFWSGYRKNSMKAIETVVNHWEKFIQGREFFRFKEITDFIVYLKNKVAPTSLQTYMNYFVVLLTLNNINLEKKEKEVIKKIIKGISEDNIVIEQFKTTWSMDNALEKLKKVEVNTQSHISHIGRKLAILMLFKYPFRAHELHGLIRENIKFKEGEIYISTATTSKTMEAGTTIKITDYVEKELNIKYHYDVYCSHTTPIKINRKGKLITPLWVKENGIEIHLITLQGWIKRMLSLLGIEGETPHSIRAAYVARHLKKNPTLENLVEDGIWKSSNTIKQFYMKPVDTD